VLVLVAANRDPVGAVQQDVGGHQARGENLSGKCSDTRLSRPPEAAPGLLSCQVPIWNSFQRLANNLQGQVQV